MKQSRLGDDVLVARIRALPDAGRCALAVACAQRLMRYHMSRPRDDRDPHIAALHSDLTLLWSAVSSPNAKADAELRRLLKKREAEPYAKQIGKNGWPRGDDHPFAAAMYALKAYCLKDPKFTVGGAMRLIEAASEMASAISETIGEDLMSPQSRLRRRSAERSETNRVISAIQLIERQGITSTGITALSKIFAGHNLGKFRARRARAAL